MNSDTWYNEYLETIMDRLKAVLTIDSDALNPRVYLPEDVQQNPKVQIFVEETLNRLGVSFPEVKGIEMLKHKTQDDIIAWMAHERPSMITTILQD
jgi:hypothetical protein